MKIGLDIRNIGKKRTGDEVVFFNLAKNLALLDNQNEYFLFTDTNDASILENIKNDLGISKKNNFKIISLASGNRFCWNFWTLQSYLRKNPVDIYVTQYITPFFVPKEIKVCTIIHDISFNFFPQFIRFSDLFFLKVLIPLSLKRADKIIGVSQFTHDEIIKYYKTDPDKVAWIHNAISENFFANIEQEKLEAIRKKYALPEKFILYLGTMQPRKNLPVLLEGYAQLPENVRNEIKVVLAGKRGGYNYDENIDTKIKKYSLQENILFPGYISEEDKPALFRLATIFAFPSLYEGFGIPILEAMSQGIPALISDIPPHREIAGESAVFFNPNRANDFKEKAEELSLDENLRQEIEGKGRTQARKFSWNNSTENFLKILKIPTIDKEDN